MLKNYKKIICLFMAVAMVFSLSAPVFAVEESAEEKTLEITANYYDSGKNDQYDLFLTVRDKIDPFTELGFKLAIDGAEVDSAEFKKDVLTDSENEVLRGTNYVTYKLTRETAKGISARTQICSVRYTAEDDPIDDDVTVTNLYIINEDGDKVEYSVNVSVMEGPIVPELSEDEQDVYDKITDLPNPEELSFYDDDALVDIGEYIEELEVVDEAYEDLSPVEQENVEAVLEYNGYDTNIISELKAIYAAMDKTRGVIEISYVLENINEENALEYQFLLDVFNDVKGSVSTQGLPSGSTVLKEVKDCLIILSDAYDLLKDVLKTADYTDKTYACEEQIDVIQTLGKHKYYQDYLAALKEQVSDLKDDIDKNYDEKDKRILVSILDECETAISQIENGAEDIPKMYLDGITYKLSYDIEFKRNGTLSSSQDAYVNIVVTDEDGEEIETATAKFPYNSKSITVSMHATAGIYPMDEYVTVTAEYVLDGATFKIASKEYECTYMVINDNKPSGIGKGAGGSSIGGSNSSINKEEDDEEKEPTTGGTRFPQGNDTPEEKDEEIVFNDIDNYGWAEEAILGLYEVGIVNGMEEGVFNPAGRVTREQFSKMVVELFELKVKDGKTNFVDVKEDAWYAPYVAAALNAGYIQGQSNEYFGIGEEIMRQDMATILYRALDDSNSKVVLDFTDNDDIAEYAIDAIAELVGLGIMNGYEDGSFQPRGTATRAEAAKVVWGIYLLLNE